MPKEAPFISKALKLVSLAIILATVAIASTAAYSGYEEYGALTSTVASNGSNQLAVTINGSTLSITGLNVPNKMTFPLTLELFGGISLDNITVGSFNSGAYVIQPNESKVINLTVPLSFSRLLSNTQALQRAAFNSSELSITTTISAHMVPLLGINITKSANTTSGPILEDLSASLNTSAAKISSDGRSVNVPLVFTWQNASPLSAGAIWASATLTNIPGKPAGNYGEGAGQVNLIQGTNTQSIELALPVSDFTGPSLPPGTYLFEISLSQSDSSQPFAQISRSVNL